MTTALPRHPSAAVVPASPARPPRHAFHRRAGRRLRRHRDEPAVRAEGGLRRHAPSRAGRRRQRPRHPVAGVLVAGDHRLDQVHRLHHARRQQGRGRNHGADGARALLGEEPAARARADADGALRSGALLRRRDDHAGHLGPVGGRGARSRDARVQAVRDSAHAGRAGRAVRGPETRHRQRRRAVRPDHDAVVRHARRRSA